MPDQLRRFADTMRDEIEPPDFELLARESRRRRRTTVIASGLAVTAVVVGVALWGHAASDRSAPLPPVDRTPTPTVSTTATTLTADQVVDASSSFVSSLAVSPTDPDVAAAVWWHCVTKDCNHGLQAALAVTTDNWATRSTRLLESFSRPTRSHVVVNALSDGRLLLHRMTTYGKPAPVELRLLSDDLSTTPLVEKAGANSLRDDEVMPATVFAGGGAWAIDPRAGTYRDLARGNPWTSVAQTSNGVIVASTSENRVGYSADFGATWRYVPDDAVSRAYGRNAVASAQPGTIAVLEGNGGCEGGCPDTLDLSRDSGATWSTVDLGGYIGHEGVITSHGSLIFLAHHPFTGHPAVLRSTADNLGELHAVLRGGDVDRLDRLALSESGGTETITACADHGFCARSDDDGRTWSTYAMR